MNTTPHDQDFKDQNNYEQKYNKITQWANYIIWFWLGFTIAWLINIKGMI